MFPRSIFSVVVLASSVTAFAPAGSSTTRPSAVRLNAEAEINGWAADASKPCYGLPGAVSPMGFFDPLGFTKGADLNGVKRLREAEIMHGRVSMMAVVGYLIGENTPTIAFGFEHPTIGNDQLAVMPATVLLPLFLFINFSEAYRASKGWVEPSPGSLFTLREDYYPGDLGFDPMGLKPNDAKDFEEIQTQEISNGRLAMIAVAGIVVQELINGESIVQNIAKTFV